MKTSIQLNSKIRNLAPILKVKPEILLRNFILERFLERLSNSEYRNNFVLKGGMLISSLVGLNKRNSMDMDTTIIDKHISESNLVEMLNSIIKLDINDGVSFVLRKIEKITDDSECPGYRISFHATFDKIRQDIKIDITTGDIITPNAINYNFPLMFSDKSINILTYNLETILAEKFETIISRDILNTRARDFYDIHILNQLFPLDEKIFINAVLNTCIRRNSINALNNNQQIINRIENEPGMSNLWERYKIKNESANGISWESAMESLKKLSSVINNNLIPEDVPNKEQDNLSSKRRRNKI